MAAPTEYVCQLTVISASCLPATDRLSKIDPYVIVKLNGKQVHKTPALQDTEEPCWNSATALCLAAGAQAPSIIGVLEFLIYDENTFKDTHIATVTLDLSAVPVAELARVVLPITQYAKSKFAEQGRAAQLVVGLAGLMQSCASIRSMFGAMPGFIASPHTPTVFIPVTAMQGLVYVSVEYEGSKVDIKAYVTRPDARVFIDLLNQSGKKPYKARRKTYVKGKTLAPGLVVFEEAKLDDLSITTDFNLVSLLVFDSTLLGSTSADQVVKRHGWKGALGFSEAARTLHGVEVDYEEEEIYMTVDAGETLLLVDYDQGDVDIKLGVLASPATADKGYDLTIRGADCDKTSEIYVPYKSKLHGRVALSRLYELDDVPYGTGFADITIHRFHLTNARTFTVQGLTRLHG